MITKVFLENDLGFQQELPLVVSGSNNPFTVRGIDGLGPTKATLATVALSSRDGVRVLSSKIDPRSITISLGISPDYSTDQSVQEVRQALDDRFGPGMPVKFYVYTSTPEVFVINGYIETMSPVLFTKDPTIQFGILCEDPFFRYPAATVRNGTNGVNLSFVYEGNAPTGLAFLLTAGAAIPTFNLRRSTPFNKYFYYDQALLTGDKVAVNTNSGSRSVKKTTGVTTDSALKAWRTTSDWLQVLAGNNTFLLSTAGNVAASYSLTYTAKFIGI